MERAPHDVRYVSEHAPIGVGIAARRCMRSLVAAGVDVAWSPLDNGPAGRVLTNTTGDAPPWLAALAGDNPRNHPTGDSAVVLHTVPGAWKQIRSDLKPTRTIGHTVWELDEVPQRWVALLADVDELWVPTEWNRQAFERVFDRPVHLVPHAIDTSDPLPPPLTIPDDHQVVSIVAAWDWRKRPDRALEACLHAFTSADPVTIVVKTSPTDTYWPGGPIDVSEMITNIMGRFPSPAHVIVATEPWTDGQLRGLARRSCCHLALSAAEGWALGPFDAACEATPVVITGWGGHLEYLGADYPGLVPYRTIATNHVDRDLFELGTTWAHPDLDAAVDLLRAVVAGDAPELERRAATLAPRLREQFSVETVGAQARSALA